MSNNERIGTKPVPQKKTKKTILCIFNTVLSTQPMRNKCSRLRKDEPCFTGLITQSVITDQEWQFEREANTIDYARERTFTGGSAAYATYSSARNCNLVVLISSCTFTPRCEDGRSRLLSCVYVSALASHLLAVCVVFFFTTTPRPLYQTLVPSYRYYNDCYHTTPAQGSHVDYTRVCVCVCACVCVCVRAWLG